MTDNENLDETEGKELSGYAKQRAKYKEELDAKDQEIASLKARIVADKKAYFKNTLTSQWFKGEFDEFADKYADKLDLDEMVALYVWNNWRPVQQVQQEQAQQTPGAQQSEQTLGPKSIIWQNPIGGDQPKQFSEMTVEEMKARGRSHPEIINQ